uniref:interferon-stimulated 20 kDa exonuclease-like 2 isoform X1 n=1 Tax=Gasterosteus aculeatus aculeatus TaxID=481459 RepID=UPI001A9A08E7|nr:interferon-stimulated 20 kDa exonuclease-like 2 isoform X1 [Gasterosteus aculeatus aculeatus]XP_040021043.1 interferon-stimulated 20 kDa exonuclease-like 2 isoform X1 [Gasterosteus aculeatus aculeatus]XP_040021044.1 interferon-stimulated 20 kDa exonuclease-like 2 isoform X1 [Gasterosteus aculeatus aculeatus]XP_040021046.1 interferon-stimulated 20 kDa exonuclease-like 2 isoform X1 [Gasterosteus aculeatus aculeatus]
MSDITLNLSCAGGAARRRPPRGYRGGHKRVPNRTHQMSFLGHARGRGARPEHYAPPRQNGAFAQLVSSPSGAARGAGAPRVSHSASSSARQSPPLMTSSRGCGGKPSEPAGRPASAAAHRPSPAGSHRAAAQTSTGIPAKYLALDCEMVGTGPKGSISKLARCSLVSYDGDVVYDKFINPPVPVTDYRTRWSGIRRSDLVNAAPYLEARKEQILRLLMGKVVIGHAVHNDFNVLGYSHPAALTRDTSRIPLLNQRAGFAVTECASLKRLTKAIFNRDIQTGKKGHSSVEDARATMELYKVVEEEWERTLASSRSQAS